MPTVALAYGYILFTLTGQSARMSKIPNDCLTRSGRMLYSCTHVGVKGLIWGKPK